MQGHGNDGAVLLIKMGKPPDKSGNAEGTQFISSPFLGVVGFRVLGFRVLGFRVLGLKVQGSK